MRHILIIASIVLLQTFACSKKTASEPDSDCVAVLITQTGTPCSEWGIRVNGVTYPSSNIPDEFKLEGSTFCANYELYDDLRMCACCGGTWANIKSIKRFSR